MSLHTVMTFKALGTIWYIDLPKDFNTKQLQTDILKRVSTFEASYSRFKNTSLLYILNKTKKFINPSDEFVSLVEFGLKMHKQTKGLFNMSVGAQLEIDGYGKPTTDDAEVSADLSSDVLIGKDKITLSSSTILDFGGFGKGWLVDEIGQIIHLHGIKDFIINGGGDILVGDNAQEIFIEHPIKSGTSVRSIILKNQALASSSNLKRTWKTKDGKTKSHIINPFRSSQNNLISVHVIASSCRMADSLATVMLIANKKNRADFNKKFQLKTLEIT